MRALEEYGAEAWLSDIVEWIWYTNSEHFRKLKLDRPAVDRRKRWAPGCASACRSATSTCCWNPSSEDFAGREEPDIYEILECARPYLPREGAFGEMVLNVGKVVYLAKQGRRRHHRHQPLHLHERHRLRGHLSPGRAATGGIPIRNFYFDGTQSDLDRDLGVYMELARGYRKKLPVSNLAGVYCRRPGS